jgi:aminopeptidase N
MTQRVHTPTRLVDYTPPAFLIDTIDLHFELGEQDTLVRSTLAVRRNPEASIARDLRLDGQDLPLVSACIDAQVLAGARTVLEPDSLTVKDVPDRFELSLCTRIQPQHNTALEGLYRSSGNFCTQCEAEGFRRITWSLDRPDVMSVYTTTIVADRTRYPVLLSNGNQVESRSLDDGRALVRWHDPFPKPSYLFALVAGDLACVEDRFVTRTGREVSLRLYVQHHNVDRCDHAMRSLKKSMRWDEDTYGLEYDLDLYMVVAVDDFNMGAMENKGLNVFNSKYVLARPDTATDSDFLNIEGVIAHEYFHNWTGNRVTCRDWFQLSLKEGLTVFRDQEFSSDVGARGVKRIQDVRILRTHQFAEDAGPMAHPVRPESYIEISNFYTVTIYNKGAEVIRMMQTILGDEGFKKGFALYLRRHDGQAVTTEDFVCAMEDANATSLEQFRRWYTQAGTPVIEVSSRYDADSRSLELALTQHCPAPPGTAQKQPFHVPLRLALLDDTGGALPLTESSGAVRDGVLHLTEAEQTLEFRDLPAPPVVSIGRGFSAPVHLKMQRSEEELAFLMARDDDTFSRWDSAQTFALTVILSLIETLRAGDAPALPSSFLDAFGRVLGDWEGDRALIAESLSLPTESYIADQLDEVDVDVIHEVRQMVRRTLAWELQERFHRVMMENRANGPYSFDPPSVGRRALKNLCLGYLMEVDDPEYPKVCLAQVENADNMTDNSAALAILAQHDCDERDAALALFEQRFGDDPLVMDKWFTTQATSCLPDTLARVETLLGHPGFDLHNPNRVRSLIGAFCHGNPLRFHAADGSGYRFLGDQIIALDGTNPQVAARLAAALSRWRRHDGARRELMQQQLERILGASSLSRDTYEVASKSLA